MRCVTASSTMPSQESSGTIAGWLFAEGLSVRRAIKNGWTEGNVSIKSPGHEGCPHARWARLGMSPE